MKKASIYKGILRRHFRAGSEKPAGYILEQQHAGGRRLLNIFMPSAQLSARQAAKLADKDISIKGVLDKYNWLEIKRIVPQETPVKKITKSTTDNLLEEANTPTAIKNTIAKIDAGMKAAGITEWSQKGFMRIFQRNISPYLTVENVKKIAIYYRIPVGAGGILGGGIPNLESTSSDRGGPTGPLPGLDDDSAPDYEPD